MGQGTPRSRRRPVSARPYPPEATDEEKGLARKELLRGRESLKIIDLAEPPVAGPHRGDGEVVFRSGDFVCAAAGHNGARPRCARQGGTDRTEAKPGAQRMLLWRVGVGCVVLFGLLALRELALFEKQPLAAGPPREVQRPRHR